MIRLPYVITIILLMQSTATEARFNHRDIRVLDDEKRIGYENYIDKKSYQWSLESKKRWQRQGFRVTAGSLNANRFHYREEIFLRSKSPTSINLEYQRVLHQDYTTEELDEYIGVLWTPWPPLTMKLHGDGDSFKKWGDVGISATLTNSNFTTEAYGYSVDHYYNQKEDEGDMIFLKPARTAGGKISKTKTDRYSVTLQSEIDFPLEYSFDGQTLGYSYERKFHRAQIKFGPNDSAIKLDISTENKREGYYNSPYSDFNGISFERDTMITDISHTKGATSTLSELGLRHIQRDALYEHDDKRDYPDISRQEYMAYYFRSSPLTPSISFQSGLLSSRVFVQKRTAADNLEVKAHTSFVWIIDERSTMTLGGNWNVDHLVEDYPFVDAPFRPWNGGNLQFQIGL